MARTTGFRSSAARNFLSATGMPVGIYFFKENNAAMSFINKAFNKIIKMHAKRQSPAPGVSTPGVSAPGAGTGAAAPLASARFDIVRDRETYSKFVNSAAGYDFSLWLAARARDKKDPRRAEILQILKILYDKKRGLQRTVNKLDFLSIQQKNLLFNLINNYNAHIRSRRAFAGRAFAGRAFAGRGKACRRA